jgi:hypothetical protein
MSSSLESLFASRSSLTPTQIQSIILQKRVQKKELTASEAIRKRGAGGVTSGAYYRVVGQARSNIEEALYTLLFCSRAGVIQMDDLRRLLDLISSAPTVDEQSVEQVISLVDALVKRIVML